MSNHVAMLSTYPPTQCGIATFARSMSNAMNRSGGSVNIIRMTKGDPAQVAGPVAAIHRGSDDLPRTLHVLNGHDAVVIQHEFGIYEGSDGSEVLDILSNVHVPVVTILHTVLRAPTNGQRRVMQGLLNGSDAVVVLSQSAAHSLGTHYDLDKVRLYVVPHGAPDFSQSPRPLGYRMSPRMLTWGLLSPGKGIEWGITALSLLRDVDPLPEYYIVGQTHPKVLAQDGYAYRDSLGELASDLGVHQNVHFIDGYLDTQSLAQLVNSADFYLLPYDTSEQVTSGVLAEAVVAGGPVIATRFPHAVELLGDGTGMLVDQKSPESIARAMRTILTEPQTSHHMRHLSARKSRQFLWPRVGASMNSLINSLIYRNNQHRLQKASSLSFQSVPA